MLAYEADRPERVAARLPGDALVGEHGGAPVAIVTDPGGPGRRAELERASAIRAAGSAERSRWLGARSRRAMPRSPSRWHGPGELVDAGRAARST